MPAFDALVLVDLLSTRSMLVLKQRGQCTLVPRFDGASAPTAPSPHDSVVQVTHCTIVPRFDGVSVHCTHCIPKLRARDDFNVLLPVSCVTPYFTCYSLFHVLFYISRVTPYINSIEWYNATKTPSSRNCHM